MTDNGWVLAVLKENRVVLPVLDFDNGALAYLVTSLFRRSDVRITVIVRGLMLGLAHSKRNLAMYRSMVDEGMRPLTTK